MVTKRKYYYTNIRKVFFKGKAILETKKDIL